MPVCAMKAHRGRYSSPALGGSECSLSCLSCFHPVPTEEEGGWAQNMVWIFLRRGKSLAPASKQILDPAAVSLVTILTTLFWLPFWKSLQSGCIILMQCRMLLADCYVMRGHSHDFKSKVLYRIAWIYQKVNLLHVVRYIQCHLMMEIRWLV